MGFICNDQDIVSGCKNCKFFAETQGSQCEIGCNAVRGKLLGKKGIFLLFSLILIVKYQI